MIAAQLLMPSLHQQTLWVVVIVLKYWMLVVVDKIVLVENLFTVCGGGGTWVTSTRAVTVIVRVAVQVAVAILVMA